MSVVQVALPVPLARTFDYRLDSAMACPVVGARVSVPFGKRKAIGIVVGLSDTSTFPLEQLKTIETRPISALMAMVCHRARPRYTTRKLKTRAQAAASACRIIAETGLSPSG